MLSNREKESFRFLSMDSCYSYYIFGRNRIFMIIKAPIHFEYRSRGEVLILPPGGHRMSIVMFIFWPLFQNKHLFAVLMASNMEG